MNWIVLQKLIDGSKREADVWVTSGSDLEKSFQGLYGSLYRKCEIGMILK